MAQTYIQEEGGCMSRILELDSITMQFGGVVAVNDLSMHVDEGEIVALIGPNGAGKTTAFNCITGVYEPTNGAVLYKGNAIIQNHPSGKMKRLYAGLEPDKFSSSKVLNPTPDKITKLGIARTFQNIRLFRSMTVFDNVLTAMHMRMNAGIFSDVFRISHAEEARMREETEVLLRRQSLWELRDELATSLPYGKQRRLEIARALATKPQLLLLDEPAAGMNPQETQELASFIHEIKDEYSLTVLMIEHHMDLVMRISDRIYVLDFGSLIAEGTPEEVQSDQRVIDAYLGVAENV